MNRPNGWQKKLALMVMVFFIFNAVGSAIPLPDRSGANGIGFIEKDKTPGKNTIKKSGFPWLWLAGGLLGAGVVIYLLVHKSASEQKDPDLQLEWLLSGNALDSSGKNRHGVVYGAMAIPDRKGAANSAYDFDGGAQYINGPDFIGQKNNQVSASLWVRITPLYQYKYFILCNDFGIFQNGNNVGMAISIPSTNSTFASITPNVWTHIVGTYDGQTIRVYANGVLAATKSHPGNIKSYNYPFAVGKMDAIYWSGAVDDIRLYSRVLSPSDIMKLYNE